MGLLGEDKCEHYVDWIMLLWKGNLKFVINFLLWIGNEDCFIYFEIYSGLWWSFYFFFFF